MNIGFKYNGLNVLFGFNNSRIGYFWQFDNKRTIYFSLSTDILVHVASVQTRTLKLLLMLGIFTQKMELTNEFLGNVK